MKELRQALAGFYDIEAPLGRGGMALVYLARERRLDRRVALKVLLPDLAADETCRLRFLSEARTIARLTHPNIVPIFTVDDIGGFVFFAMAYVPGETLSHRVASQGPIDPQQAGRLICDIGEALDYAHARGVVHRDVKPDNILLDAFTGRALLTDFGIAHSNHGRIPYGQLGRPAAPRGRVVGTAAFMSPEQARGDVVDARSDIYSLGVVAYYILSGQLPLDALTDEALLALHVNAPPPSLSTVAPFTPPRLAQIVDRCLAKAPWERFPDAAALVKEVAEAVGERPAPLAVRAFLVRSAHLEAPALIHAAFTGVGLVPALVAAWSSTTSALVRGVATGALAAALALPVIVQIVRVRRLLAAGHRREELVAALAARQARRREELAFVYGSGPTSFENSLAWLARVNLLLAIAALVGALGGGAGAFAVPDSLLPLLSPISAAAAVTAVLASIVARARTEQRTDPIGERHLRFWRGPFGRALFRVAGLRFNPVVPVVRILDHLETPA
jgi:serine/threonine-protein kinase